MGVALILNSADQKNLIGLLGVFVDKGFVDVGNHASGGDGGFDQGIWLHGAADSELQVAGGDALDLFWGGGKRSEADA